jgi:hypothetical protein
MRSGSFAAALVAVLLGAGMFAWSRVRPSHDRDWSPAQARLPVAAFEDARVTIRNVRVFDWPEAGEPVERWEDRSYDLDAIERAWYVIAPFDAGWRGPAHAFISFSFADGAHVAVSIEARRERGEEYSMVKGLLKQFELVYIVGDERDLLGSRVWRQKDEVFLYPVRAPADGVRRLFVDMLGRVNGIAERPEFYGTLRSNCTTNLLAHVNALLERRIRWGPRILLPGWSDAVAMRHGLIETDLPLEEARRRFRVNDAAMQHAAAADFSRGIRVGLSPDIR